MRKYCPSCGSPNEYSFSEPVTCAQCNSKLSVASAPQQTNSPLQSVHQTVQANVTAPQQHKKLRYMQVDDDEDLLPLEIPDTLDISFSLPTTEKPTFGQIAGTEPDRFPQQSNKKLSKAQKKERLGEFLNKMKDDGRAKSAEGEE